MRTQPHSGDPHVRELWDFVFQRVPMDTPAGTIPLECLEHRIVQVLVLFALGRVLDVRVGSHGWRG